MQIGRFLKSTFFCRGQPANVSEGFSVTGPDRFASVVYSYTR